MRERERESERENLCVIYYPCVCPRRESSELHTKSENENVGLR